jgi:hypothetical protein
MFIAVVGTRDIPVGKESYVLEVIKHYLSSSDVVVSGGAKGIDSLARQYCAQNNIQIIEYLPDYGKYGKVAPLIRNTDIVNKADLIIAFPVKESRGTYDTIEKAKKIW